MDTSLKIGQSVRLKMPGMAYSFIGTILETRDGDIYVRVVMADNSIEEGLNMNETMSADWIISEPPKLVGDYTIGAKSKKGAEQNLYLQFTFSQKPRWLARTMCRILLQWYWVDEKK